MTRSRRVVHPSRRTEQRIARGLLTPDGLDTTPAGEAFAEAEAEARSGYWDAPGDDGGPDGYGWGVDSVNPDSAVA